ncbi:hypothetical protein Glove_177g128 [Diversispora epigaea]|uniref:BTB domain-containing protein n=1 Tax=Diversispora epigaea TaxID=1348612 RepID=A0A397IN63_9GLOM|nr:hypothetical protein Glove_177g128 [Diversispora epigaea]
MTAKFFDRLSNDLTQLLEDTTDYNVSIEIGEAPNNQNFKVHSYILQSRCPYFKNKLNETPFNDDHIKVLTIPNTNISIKLFNVIIKYIYGGIISLEKLENSTIFDLVIASNELELDELVEYLQTYLVNNGASWLRLKFAQIYRTSYQVKNLEIIRDFYNDIIAKHPNTIFESENFHSLPENALICILKQDDLQLEVLTIPNTNISIKLFNVIIKYIYGGIISLEKLENSTIFDLVIASNELELDELVEYLQTYLVNNGASWLRLKFAQIYRTSYQVKNLEIIRDFYNDIIAKHPNTIFESENFHSLPENALICILKQDDLQLEETPYIENNPYEFKLLVRGSRDGFDVKTIYNICDKVANTVIVLKVEGTGEILGGYNPLKWDNNKNQHMIAQDSFIFSLKTANLKNSILSRAVINFDWAIYNCPRDSNLFFDSALRLIGNLKTEKRCYCRDSLVYTKPIRSDEFISKCSIISEEEFFSVEEYEVFKILPRNNLK